MSGRAAATAFRSAVSTGSPAARGRRRGWLFAAAAFGLVLVYLLAWVTYASSHVQGPGRFRQLGPGQAATVGDAQFRLLSLRQTTQMATEQGEPEAPPAAGAVWVIADLEMVQARVDPERLCSFAVLGPGRRLWESTTAVGRDRPSSCRDVTAADRAPGRFETTFVVPESYVGQLRGVVVRDVGSAARQLVLTPP